MSRTERITAGVALALSVLLLVNLWGAYTYRVELRERMDALTLHRSGREWTTTDADTSRYLECRALILADDWDGAGCAWEWQDLADLARVQWGPDGDPETGGAE